MRGLIFLWVRIVVERAAEIVRVTLGWWERLDAGKNAG